MSNYLILSQYRNDSEYNDFIGILYHFPAKYKNLIQEGSEFVYYEPKKKGKGVYFGYGKIGKIFEDRKQTNHYYAQIDDYKEFNRDVPLTDQDDLQFENTKQYNPQNAVRYTTAEIINKLCTLGGISNSFNLTPRVLAHLGEDLIKNESIALLELVKNSYDACATYCTVEFTFEKNVLDTITIKDNGTGMNINTIKNVWLVVGTDNKKDIKPVYCNKNKRYPLGEKGIGRLGIHKLGNKIDLYTRSQDDDEINVMINWKKLDSSKSIEDFPVRIKIDENPIYFTDRTGTKIIIRDIKGNFDRRKLREIYRSLTSLNSPFDDVSDQFRVNVSSNTNIFDDLPSFEDIKKAALYFCKCKINNDRIVKFAYEFKPWESLKRIQGGRKKTEKDFDDFELLLSRKSGNKLENFDLSHYAIGPVEFDIAIFDFDNLIFNYASAFTEKSSVKKYLSENGGIRIYRDGIRVYDYGEKENDWLGIDLKRVHRVGGNISNHIVIGAVKLNRALSTDLKEKTNREGFVENDAYHTFVDAIDYALDLIVKERNLDKAKLTTLYKKNKVIEPVLSDLEEVKEIVNTKIKDNEIKIDILKYLERVDKQYKEVKEVLVRSANAGLNLGIAIHEIEKLIASLTGAVKRQEVEKIKNISLQLEKIINGYSIMLKNSSIKKDKLSNIVDIAVNNYEFRFSDHRITLKRNYDEPDLEAWYPKSEAVSILTNLLDNSIFWLSYARISDRYISIFITNQIEGYHSIVVSDNGPGFKIPPEDAIKPFITGKPHSIGSGLGLHIADEMLKAMKGKLLFLSKYDLDFPEEVVEKNITNAIVAISFPTKKPQP
jgi:signal transduction histidine kinase